MFGFTGVVKEKRQKESKKEYAVAPGTNIRFNPKLTGQLTHEHQELLNLYIKANNALKAFDAIGIAEALQSMRDLLQNHLLTENVRIYVYLEHMFANDEVNCQLVRDFRREMDQISRTVMAFFNKYQDIGSGKYPLDQFAKEFQALGVELNRRIEQEEQTLYPLYLTHS